MMSIPNPYPKRAKPSTQEEYPWRAVVRTVFEQIVSLAAMWAVIVVALGIDEKIPWVAASLATSAAITRVMALPAVNEWLGEFVPWLAAKPPRRVGQVSDE